MLIIILITLSAFFSASETALTGANRIRLKHRAENGSSSAKKALKLLLKYDRALTTLLIGNNIVNLAAASIATVLAITSLPESLSGYAMAISTVSLTLVVLIFGEILPKSLAREHSETFILGVAGVLNVLMVFMLPISAVLLLLQRATVKLFCNKNKEFSVTEEELMQIIDEIEDEGVLEEHESSLVRSALEFDETAVEKILTPRVSLTAVALSDTIEKVRDVFLESGYSRLPVYDKTPDKICGVISHKDFMRSLISGADLQISDIMCTLPKISALTKLPQALKLLQSRKSHLAVVLDQHGGTEGIVTLEDILEELVGEIWDESDEETQPVKFTGETTFEVAGELTITDFNRAFQVYSDVESIEIDSDSNTVAGWAFELFGKIPEEGETVENETFRVTVMSMEGRRIGRLRFEVLK
ncbi:MAG: hemolysin family protein [Oscillospiraceae bacterium]|nr:hemolysin family protein [Oscillospiraceae bacterium]